MRDLVHRKRHPGAAMSLAAALFAVALAAGCSRSGPAGATAESPAALAVIPVTAGGLQARVRQAPGRAVLVNVWATWCVPCREEFPDLVRLRRDLGEQGFELYLVSADFGLEDGSVRAFLAAQGVDFETFFKEEKDMPFIETMHPEWSGALPASFLYDDAGKLVRFWQGKASYEELHEEVQSVLQQGTRPTTHPKGGTAS